MTTSTSQATPTTAVTTSTTMLAPSSTDAGAACEAGESGADSPLASHQVFVTTSPDAATFSADFQLVMDMASVPDGTIGPDGSLWVYFVNGEPGRHGIFAARQTGTDEWEKVDCIRIDGEFVGDAVDPDIVRLDDGTYLLFYYVGHFVTRPVPDGEPHPIYRAVSTDGIHFTSATLAFTAEAITDPTVTRLANGSWLMALMQNGHVLLAGSDDGLVFDELMSIDLFGIPELLTLPNGTVRLVASTALDSRDGGITWVEVSTDPIPGGGADPSFVQLDDGGYAFFFKEFDR